MSYFQRLTLVAAVIVSLTGFNASAATFTVVNTADAGAGSLRAAIDSANLNPGADVINFNVAGSPAVINVTGSLPAIVDTVTIDGYSNPGAAAANTDPTISNAVITVEVVGDTTGTGFTVTGGTATIRGLSILNFATGILTIVNGQLLSEGNFIGVRAGGLTTLSNGIGIFIETNVPNRIGGTTPDTRNLIGGNTSVSTWVLGSGQAVIEGNLIGLGRDGTTVTGGGTGVSVLGTGAVVIGGATAASRNVIAGLTSDGILSNNPNLDVIGNYIGTDVTGLAARPNNGSGIFGAGGTVDIRNNVLSGNTRSGVEIGLGTGGTIRGNFIGVGSDGLTRVQNDRSGILLETTNFVAIGGFGTADRNIISGNALRGIEINNGSAQAQVINNYIGLAADGLTARPNQLGVVIDSASNLNTIDLNVISGNSLGGIDIAGLSNGNTVSRNIIGRTADLSLPVGNNAFGVRISSGSNNNQVGGAGLGNTIHDNLGFGVGLDPGAGNSNPIRHNSIFGNSVGLGIDLNLDGVTPNDPGDGDAGPNTLQNFPVVTLAAGSATVTQTAGTLSSTPSTTFEIDVFASSVADPTGFGEGQRFLGFTSCTTDATGTCSWAATFPGATVATDVITATATSTATSSTSEFSAAVTVTPIGAFNFSAPAYSVAENGLLATITVTRTSGGGTATVDYATSNGTATAGSDYGASSGTLTFNAGETSKTFTVTLTDDSTFEGNETINLTLSNPTNGATLGAQSTAVLTLLENDTAPVFTIGDATVTEGNAGTVNATFTVTLSGSSAVTATVNYATANGTAVAPTDYTATSGTLTFLTPGTQTVTVAVNGDTTFESDETFNVVLSAPTNATLGAPSSGTGTITNDDPTVSDLSGTKTVSPGPYFGSQNVTYTITVVNAGPDTTTATVMDTLPGGTTFVSAVPTQGTCSGTTVITCSLGNLANGATATVTLTVTLPALGGTITNSATVSAGGADPILTNNNPSVTITAAPASAIPTLSEWILIAMVGALALLGAMRMR